MLIRVADVVIEIHLLFEGTSLLLKDYIVEDSQFEPDIVLHYNYDDVAAEQLITKQGSVLKLPASEIRFFNREKHEFFAIHRKIANEMPKHSVFLMHGAVVGTNGQAYMFAAPSGVGKTTRARLWLNEFPNSVIVNGDKPLIKVTETEVLACGTPWSGKEGYNTNQILPLKAIFLLERSQSDSIEEISFGDALPKLLKQTYLPPQTETLHNTIMLLHDSARHVKLYRFASTQTPDAIRLAYETVNQR